MSPGKISEKVVTDRLSWIEEMLDGIRALPFYDQVSTEELYATCAERVGDVLQTAYCLRDWVASHPEMVDRTL